MEHADYEGGDPARVGKKGFLHWLINSVEGDIETVEEHLMAGESKYKQAILHNLHLIVKKAKILRDREVIHGQGND